MNPTITYEVVKSEYNKGFYVLKINNSKYQCTLPCDCIQTVADIITEYLKLWAEDSE